MTTTQKNWDYHVEAVATYGCPICHSDDCTFIGATQARTDGDYVDIIECPSCDYTSRRAVYMVDDLQAVEPDSLMDTDGITVEVEDGLDSMGFNRVSVQAATAAEVIEFIRENWGDDDPAWFQEWVLDRISVVQTATA